MPDTEPCSLHALLQFILTTICDTGTIVTLCNSEEPWGSEGLRNFYTNDELGFETSFM